MLRKIWFPILLGLSGVIVLVSLGSWQLDRLQWKQEIIAEVGGRLVAAPSELPARPDEATQEYTRVTMAGIVTGPELHVLASGTAAGTGYRVIQAFETSDGRRVLLDAGLLPLTGKDSARPASVETIVTGTLVWPDDVNSSTPEPDLAKNIWFGRDVAAMSDVLGTEPVMVIASTATPPDPRLTPLPVDRAGIKNDHLEYALTWFGLALVWAIMTFFLIFRTLRAKDT